MNDRLKTWVSIKLWSSCSKKCFKKFFILFRLLSKIQLSRFKIYKLFLWFRKIVQYQNYSHWSTAERSWEIQLINKKNIKWAICVEGSWWETDCCVNKQQNTNYDNDRRCCLRSNVLCLISIVGRTWDFSPSKNRGKNRGSETGSKFRSFLSILCPLL